MAEYVRICPKCGQANPEYENLCGACGQFIGMESTVPAPRPAEPPATASAGPEPVQATRRYVPVAESFYLQLADAQLTLTVRPGNVLGQAHESSDAEIQVPAAVEGAAFLHRRHCRFERGAEGWQVTAIDQVGQGSEFTNPTFVNQHRLKPGHSHPIKSGDQLRLSGLTFDIRMV